jgi:hypothetical protein
MLRKIASGGYGNVFLRKSGRKKTNVLKKIKSRNEFGRRITNTQTNLSHECRIARKIHKYVPKHIINIKNLKFPKEILLFIVETFLEGDILMKLKYF